jgi:hypothetical protein
MNPGAYPKVIVGVDLSSGVESTCLTAPDALADLKMQAANDAKKVGAISAEAAAPGPMIADAPKKLKPSTAEPVPIAPPLAGVAESAYTLLLSDPT